MGWIFLCFMSAGLVSLLSWNLRRSKEHKSFTLKPNCLITKHPLIFINGRKSIFYFLGYWNQLPQFLSQHGYEVFEYDLHWRNPKKRVQQLRDFLKQSEGIKKYHLIIDRSSLDEVKTLFAKETFLSVASCTLITNRTPFFIRALRHPVEELLVAKRKDPLSLKVLWFFHRFWTQSWEADTLSLAIENQKTSTLNKELEILQSHLLERVILLAERDFVQAPPAVQKHLNLQQGNSSYDDIEKRTSSHSIGAADLPASPC